MRVLSTARGRTPSSKPGPRIVGCRFSQGRASGHPFALTTLPLVSTHGKVTNTHTQRVDTFNLLVHVDARCKPLLISPPPFISLSLSSVTHPPRSASPQPSHLLLIVSPPNGPRLRQRPPCRYRPSHPLPPSSPSRYNPTLPIRAPPLQNPQPTSSRPPTNTPRPPAPKVFQIRPLANILPDHHLLGPRLYPATMWTANEECGCTTGVAGEDRVVEYCVYSLGIRRVLYAFDEADYVSRDGP